MASVLKLEDRGVIRISGPEAKSLLQGLITNDIELLSHERALYAALLTPQGKFLFDMMIHEQAHELLLDVEKSRMQDLIRRLMMYRLRADATIEEATDLHVWAIWDGTTDNSVPDPRCEDLGHRVIAADSPIEGADVLSFRDYEEKRIKAGVPDSSRDMMVEKYFWLETDAERLNGVSFTKGCFIGQELTARMKHRTTLKKKLVPVSANQSLGGQEGSPITTEDGKTAGTLHSTVGNNAIAYMRLEYLDGPFVCNGISLEASR